jgi:hypothetical protein
MALILILDFGFRKRISIPGLRKFGIVEAIAAFVAVLARALLVGEQGWLCCAAVQAFVEAGFVAEAHVGEAHKTGWAVIFGSAECVWRDGRERAAAFQTIFDF